MACNNLLQWTLAGSGLGENDTVMWWVTVVLPVACGKGKLWQWALLGQGSVKQYGHVMGGKVV